MARLTAVLTCAAKRVGLDAHSHDFIVGGMVRWVTNAVTGCTSAIWETRYNSRSRGVESPKTTPRSTDLQLHVRGL